MNSTASSGKSFLRRGVLALAVAAVFAGGTSCFADSRPLRAAKAGRAAPKADGLDGLDEHTLAAELSTRGMKTLLDRYFTINNVSEADQQSIKTFGAIRELSNPKVSPGEKMRIVKAVADGIDTVLPSLRDPAAMLNTAAALKESGVDHLVNNIEYWGEDPVTQSQLKPLADAVVKLIDTAATSARAQADELGGKLKGDKGPEAAKYEQMDAIANTAAYTKAMSVYAACLALPAKDPARKSMADADITTLADYDTEDSMVQPRVRNMIAKLYMSAGEFNEAKKAFLSVGGDKPTVKPDPNPLEQYDARYFTVVTDIISGDMASARADKASLDAWQTTKMPALLKGIKGFSEADIAATAGSVAAAGDMLEWRLHVLEGDTAKTPADKQKAEKAAEDVLLKLRQAHPELATMIDEQLVKRMPANKPIDDKTAVSLLLALVKKGKVESYKADAEKPDQVIMNKGIEAAGVLLRRKDAAITPAQREEAAYAIPRLQDRMGKLLEATNAYLDYATEYFAANAARATEALDRAGYLIFEMKRQTPVPVGFSDVYMRFLPIAIKPPFSHLKLAISYADLLRSAQNYKEALIYYRMVPASDPAAYAYAQYKQMLVLSDLRNTKQDPAEQKQTIVDLAKAAEMVKKIGQTSTDPVARAKGGQAAVLLADLSRSEDKDPKRALAALTGFEDMVKGVPGEPDLVHQVLQERVKDYMALGDTNAAVGELTKLLENAKGDDGILQVGQLLDQLDKEFARATVQHDPVKMRVIAENEATLTKYLVDWSNPATQKKESIAKLYYAYAVYDARTQRLAGSLAEDPVKRTALLTQASQRYRSLQSKQMHDLYIKQPTVKAQIDAGAIGADEVDPSVATGLAFTDFDLGNFLSAKNQLEPMIAGKKFGTPKTDVLDPMTNQMKTVDNDLYWEAQYKFIKSDYEVSKGNPKDLVIVGKILKNVLIMGGVPDRFADDFEALRKVAAPDFNPNAPATPATKPAAVAPVAAAAPGKK